MKKENILNVILYRIFLSLLVDIFLVWGFLELFKIEYAAYDFFMYIVKFWTGIYIIYIFLWLKNTGIEWLLYRINRDKTVNNMVSHFRDFNYPEPSFLEDGNFELYMLCVIDNEDIDTRIRIDAAKLLATTDALFPLGHKILSSRLFFIYSVAVARYKEVM
jgi:hypothetical protein